MSSDPQLEQLLRDARGVLPEPDAAVSERARARALAALRRRRRRRLQAALLIGAALVLAVGAGGVVGTLVAPSGTAARGPVGLGFLPASGWYVYQSGAAAAEGRPALAVASSRPLSSDDLVGGVPEASGLPYATLLTLPHDGVVIVASFRVRRFEPWLDAEYPTGELPLRLSDAAREIQYGTQVRPERPLGQRQLKVTIDGHYVDLQIYFGIPRPSEELMAAAQNQLDRLVVSSERVTMFARPAVVFGIAQPVELFGSVESTRAGETVTIQAKDCGSAFFRVVAAAETRAGGGWYMQHYPGITTTLRAVWNDAASSEVAIRVHVAVWLDRLGARKFTVGVESKRSFWRRTALIQRREGGGWATVKPVRLTRSEAAGAYSVSSAAFTLAVPKGTQLRAVVPRAQAGPCYLPGVSRTVRA